MISREIVSCPGTAIGRIISEPQWTQCKDYVHFGESRLQEYHSFVLEEEMAFRQTGGTLAFMISTFGPSAGRVFRYRKDT